MRALIFVVSVEGKGANIFFDGVDHESLDEILLLGVIESES